MLFFLSSWPVMAKKLAAFVYIKNDVKVFNTHGELVDAEKAMELIVGDVIHVGEESLAIVKIKGNSAIKLEENSELEIEELPNEENENATLFNLVKGAVMAKVQKKKDKSKSFEIRKGEVSFGVRGTKFLLGQDEESGELWNIVNEGSVEVVNFKEDDHELVGQGNGLVLTKDQKISKPSSFGWSKELNWEMDGKKSKRANFRKLRKSRREEWKKKRGKLLKRARKRIKNKKERLKKFINKRKRAKGIRKKLKSRRKAMKDKIKNRRKKLKEGRKNLPGNRIDQQGIRKKMQNKRKNLQGRGKKPQAVRKNLKEIQKKRQEGRKKRLKKFFK